MDFIYQPVVLTLDLCGFFVVFLHHQFDKTYWYQGEKFKEIYLILIPLFKKWINITFSSITIQTHEFKNLDETIQVFLAHLTKVKTNPWSHNLCRLFLFFLSLARFIKPPDGGNVLFLEAGEMFFHLFSKLKCVD